MEQPTAMLAFNKLSIPLTLIGGDETSRILRRILRWMVVLMARRERCGQHCERDQRSASAGDDVPAQPAGESCARVLLGA